MKFRISKEWLEAHADDEEGAYCPHGFLVGCPVCIAALNETRDTMKITVKNIPAEVHALIEKAVAEAKLLGHEIAVEVETLTDHAPAAGEVLPNDAGGKGPGVTS